MLGSSGVFSLTINDGTGIRGADSGHTLERVFQNRGSFASLPDCQGATSYSPSSADGRRFMVSFRDETMPNWEPLPTTLINFAPLAIEARSLGGFNASHLLRVTDDGTASGDPASAPVLTSSEASELKALAGGTSTRYMPASPGGGAALPSYPTLTPPASPIAGSVWYDSDAKAIKYFDGLNPITLGTGSGSGTVTLVTAGDGLAGGSFTVSGTISLPDVGTSGTYYKVVTDAKGRVTSGSASLAETDLPTISIPGKVVGSAITSGEITGTTSINTSGAIQTTGTLSSGSFSTRLFDLYDSDNTHRIRFQTPATGDLIADYALTWPETAGSSGQVLTTNGAGVLSWKTVSSSGGTVTGVTASAPLSSSGGVAPNITISKADNSTNGYLSSTDWNTFNSKLGTIAGSSLNEGQVWVGNGSNQAAPATPGGDVSMSNVGAVTVTGIRGYSVSAVAPTLSGQVLRYDDVATSYVPAFLSLADIRSTTSPFNTMFPNASCNSAQTLNWSSLTDTLTCTPIAIGDSAVTFASKAANAVFVGPTSGGAAAPSFRALVADDIPNLNVSKINDGVLPIARGGTGSSNGSITGSGALTFAAGGTDQNVTLTPSGTGHTVLNGNVGIGTANPKGALHVVGGIVIGSGNMHVSRDVYQYNGGVTGNTGTIKITLPTTWSTTMMRIVIHGYNYGSTTGSWSVVLGGYNYATTQAWHNVSAQIYGRPPFTQVRLGHDGTRNVILLGDLTTTTTYLKVNVAEVEAGHANSGIWASGWTVEQVTDEAGITSSNVPVTSWQNSGANSFYTAGNVGIGTVSPDAGLHVYKTSGNTARFEASSNNTVDILGSLGTIKHTYNGTSNRYTLSSNGRLDFSLPNDYTGGALQLGSDPTTSAILSGKSGGIAFFLGSGRATPSMTMNSSGNVGIGTTTPQAKLDINGFMRMTANMSAPATCSATISGSLALTSLFTTCACNGSAWVSTVDGSTACAWQ